MNRHRPTHTRGFALLSLGAALVFLWCYAIAPGFPTAAELGVHTPGSGTRVEAGSAKMVCGIASVCETAHVGAKPDPVHPPLMAHARAADLHWFFPMSAEAPQAAGGGILPIVVPYHASLLQQAVSLLI